MLAAKVLKYFEWDDVKKEICRRTDLPVEHFRDVHKVLGGDYKDLWHVFLSCIYYDELSNDSYEHSHCAEIDDVAEWAIPYVEAYNDIVQEHGGYITIHHS